MNDHPIIILGARVPAHSTRHDGAPVSRLSEIDAAMPLPWLVEAVLLELIANKASFTAYDVTMILRALFPSPHRQLPHYTQGNRPGVQPEVHRQMAVYLASGIYTTMTTYPNGIDAAQLYTPSRRRWRRRSSSRKTTNTTTPTSPSLPAWAWIITQNSNLRVA